MPNTFEIIAGFLDRFDQEVEGRELSAPPEDIQIKLREFARGTLAQTEQAELIDLLRRHPDWMAGLAEEVKRLRADPATKA